MSRIAGVFCCLILSVVTVGAETQGQSSYIVHVAPAHASRSSRPRLLARAAYTSFLRDTLPASISHPAPKVLYSYTHAATGFAARLTEVQAGHLESQPSVLAVVPDEMLQPHTTLTPSFLGLSDSSGLLPASSGAKDVVIGLIDSGVYPKNRASFAADPSLGQPPSKFRGICVTNPSFNASVYCNNKLVGAKYFVDGYEAATGPLDETQESRSPLDTEGHGTHTSSTAAGSAVPDASFFSYAKGKATGMAPGARIAAYKACWKNGCTDSDILAAFDAAIADRVDVISFSIGANGQAPKFYRDNTAIGTFGAVRKGIVVSASAGNAGPGEFTAVNIAPWILTVGASTVNRQFPATVVLGNGETYTGTSIYAGGVPLPESKIPLVYGGDVGSRFCEVGRLNARLVAGRIVLCEPGVNARAGKGEAVKLAGGAGAILAGTKEFGEQALTSAHVLPATAITFPDAERVKRYISTETRPVATIVFDGTVIGKAPSSPRMASFSSRGPNLHAPMILKPDVTAPGVDILAAWTGESSPSGLDSDKRRVQYNIISGTSMSCPHVSGIAALLRQAHPDWSPAAIKSALMTTAYNLDNFRDVIKDMSTGKASTPFMRGAGHVDPNRTLDPGLVYDAGADDYISFLCALGFTTEQISVFATDGLAADCSKRRVSAGDLNYPAFSVVFRSTNEQITQRRVVRNVGNNVGVTYTANITVPAGVRVTVKPQKLQFTATQQTQEYEVTFATQRVASVTQKYSFGSVVWSDGEHMVTSPIAIILPAASQVAVM